MWLNTATHRVVRSLHTHLRRLPLLCRRRPAAARRRRRRRRRSRRSRRAALLQAKAPLMHGLIHLNDDGWVCQECRQVHLPQAHAAVARLGERTVQTAL